MYYKCQSILASRAHISNTYWTTPQVSMGESLFNLAYKTEAVIPVEIGLSSMRVEHYTKPNNFEARRADLDLLLKVRQEA